MSDAARPATFHVTCPLCGEEIGGGPLRRDTDWPLDLLQAEIISEAWEHCYDRHPEATGVVVFHVESHVVENGAEHAQRPRVKSIHLDWELPIPLPVPPEKLRSIQRRRRRGARQAEVDQAFLRALREFGRPATTGEIGRRLGLDGRQVRPCAERLARAELVEPVGDGRWQAR